ncbi:hypothetical protein KR009_002193 [Drosophila setifemur]|nr:hypothetical protein KR009_002193 [Drosophila setifemur]
MARSKIWRYYDKLDHNTAQCQLCERVIKTCGNTSNLMKHMKTHPQINVNDNASVVVRGMFKRKSTQMQYFKEERNSSGFIGQLAMKSIKEDTNGSAIELDAHVVEVEPEDHVTVQTVGYEWTSGDISADSAAEAVSAEDIIEFEPKQDAHYQIQDVSSHPEIEEDASNINQLQDTPVTNQRTFHRHMAYFVCRDRLSPEIVQGEGFQHLIKVLCPGYKPPNSKELEECLFREAQNLTAKLRQQLAAVSSLSFSCSVQTSAKDRSWLEMVAHYQARRERISSTLPAQRLPLHFNASHVVECLERVCNRFNIVKSKITCIVTRSSRLLEDAVTSFLGGQCLVPCFAHLLNSIFEVVVQRPEISELCENVRPYVEAYLETNAPISQRMLVLDDKQRPLSSYDMLEMFLKHPLLQSEVPAPLSPAELALSQQLLDVLKPLVSSMRELSQTYFPAASQALPIAFTLINELKRERNQEHQVTRELRMFAVRQLEEHFESLERNGHLAMASLMDPRFRNLPFQSGTLVAKYMTQLYDMVQAHVESGETLATGEDPDEQYDIWAAYRAFSHDKHRHSNGSSDPDDEIATYFCSGISSLRADPLQLWQELAPAHPFLHSVAQKYLHIPASAIPPAHLFTADGATVAKQQAKLLDNDMGNVLFLADVPTNEWQL